MTKRIGLACWIPVTLLLACGGSGGDGTVNGSGGSAGAGTGGAATGGAPGSGGTPSTGGAPGTGGMAGAGTGGMAGAGTGGIGGTGGMIPMGCGDGAITAPEHCDDTNAAPHDGCTPGCQYEAFYRMGSAAISKAASPSFCAAAPANRLGDAISDLGLGQLNDGLKAGIDDGGTNIIIQAVGLEDLTGANATFDFGITSGSTDPAAGMWPGPDPLDFSFLLDPATLGSDNLPTGQMASSSTGSVFSGGPGTVVLALTIDGNPASLEMLDAAVQGRFDTLTSVPSPPPAMLAPGLVVSEAMIANGPGEGLCGGVTVESLAQIPVPGALTGSGLTACSEGYTECGPGGVDATCNSLLDVFVGGCQVLFLPVLTPTQPDLMNGGPATLTPGAMRKVPESETTGNRNAYSTFIQFAARRAHVTGTF